jgi:hypothetical protein
MRSFIGSKFDKNLTTTDIAKRIRTDIKAAIQSGELPKAKYSVRTNYFSGGSSIDVRIKKVPFKILNSEYVVQSNSVGVSQYSDKAQELLKKLETIVSAYNRDKSDTMTDYFDVKFYSHVNFDTAMESCERKEILHTHLV